jgi:hypothetical protein
MRLVMGLGAGLVLLCACGSAGGQNQTTRQNAAVPVAGAGANINSSANWATPTAPVSTETVAQPTAPTAGGPEVNATWLAGRWQVGSGPCGNAESQFSFQPDGRYALGSEQGRWSLAGTALTIEVTQAPDGHVTAGERHTSQLAAIDADTAELRKDDIPPVQLHRCR